MNLSMKLLLSELDMDTQAYTLPDNTPHFSFVELYSDKEEQRADILYICKLSEALVARASGNGYFLCVRDRISDDSETEEIMKGIVVIQKNMETHLLFNMVQRVFVRMNNWSMSLDRSIFASEGIQSLLDLSESIFKNHISVIDGSYKLMAWTKGIETDDYVTNVLLKHGYHPQETVYLFQKLRRIEEFEKNKGLIVSNDRITSEYVTVKKVFHSSGTVSSIIVMICCGRDATAGLLEIFQYLIDKIKYYIDRDMSDESNKAAARALITDILSDTIGTAEEVKARAQYARLSFVENYRACVFCFPDSNNMPIRKTIYMISSVLPNATTFSFERNIVVLLTEQPDETTDLPWIDRFKGKLADIRPYLEEFGFICGISNVFKNLLGCGTAYMQGLKAAQTALQLKPLTQGGKEKIFTFEDVWIHYVLSDQVRPNQKLFKNSSLFSTMRCIRRYDREHGTDVMNILKLYLENDCKASAVGRIMHMHRNTVLYHIERIKENLGVSLDDPEEKLKLLLAYKMEDFNQ